MTDDLERRKRTDERARWPVRKFILGQEPSEDLSSVTTPEERLAMMWDLSRSAWLLTGRPLPDYERRNSPGRVFRGRR